MLAMLQSKRDELNDLLQMKAQLQENLAEEAAAVKAPKEKAPPSPPKEKAPPSAGELKESELKAILMHRMQAQQAVDDGFAEVERVERLHDVLLEDASVKVLVHGGFGVRADKNGEREELREGARPGIEVVEEQPRRTTTT